MSDWTPKSKTIVADKTPKVDERIQGAVYARVPSWRFNRADIDHETWSIFEGFEDDIVEDESADGGTRLTYRFSPSICPDLLDHLKTRESATWKDIMQQTGGPRSNTNSHFIYTERLSDAAKARLRLLKYEYEDQIFSLRIDGKKRLFGFIDPSTGAMDVLWYDRDHSVYETKKN